MKSRWTLIALMAWAVFAPMIGLTVLSGTAQAVDVPPTSCVWVNTTTIRCTGFATDPTLSIDFTPNPNDNSEPKKEYLGGTDPEANISISIENVSANGTSGQYVVDGEQVGSLTLGSQEVSGRLANAVDEGEDGDNEDPVKCNAGKGFTWLICGTIEWSLGVIDWIRNTVIIPLLQQAPLDKDAADIKPLYDIWSGMRNVASVVLILLFLVIIFGTAIGYDNYTIKKTLPRLIATAILMPLSWYICVFMVDLGNILGQGIVAITAPLIPDPKIDFTSPVSELVYTAGGGVLLGVTGFTAYTGMLWPILLGILIGLVATFATLILRNVLILVLIVISPLAALTYILPNTSKYFSKWLDNLIRLILMYPLIVLLFEAGRLFSAVAGGF
ncbi:hypothetical protein IPG36_01930 [bacterium]|nr:MAG: hypothetical protein IPG36_01930 [bacterium]